MRYEGISAIEGNLPSPVQYDADQQGGIVTFNMNNYTKELTINSGSYFTKKEVMELAMILLRLSNQMVDYHS